MLQKEELRLPVTAILVRPLSEQTSLSCHQKMRLITARYQALLWVGLCSRIRPLHRVMSSLEHRRYRLGSWNLVTLCIKLVESLPNQGEMLSTSTIKEVGSKLVTIRV